MVRPLQSRVSQLGNYARVVTQGEITKHCANAISAIDRCQSTRLLFDTCSRKSKCMWETAMEHARFIFYYVQSQHPVPKSETSLEAPPRFLPIWGELNLDMLQLPFTDAIPHDVAPEDGMRMLCTSISGYANNVLDIAERRIKYCKYCDMDGKAIALIQTKRKQLHEMLFRHFDLQYFHKAKRPNGDPMPLRIHILNCMVEYRKILSEDEMFIVTKAYFAMEHIP